MSSIVDRMLNGSTGMQAARMMEALGMPSTIAETVGAQVDASRGDMAGVQRLMMAATQGLSTAQMDNLFGKGLAPMGFVPRPNVFLGAALAANPLLGKGFNPFGGVSREAPFGTGSVGRSIERAINRDPFFKAMMERQLGGTIIADGRNDGRLTVYRSPFNQLGGVARTAINAGIMPAVGLAGTFANMALPFGGGLGANLVANSIMRGMMRMEGNMTSLMGGITGDNVMQARGELMKDRNTAAMARGMGIDIRNASFEDILFLMLMKYAKKKEDDIMAKVKQLDASSKAAENKGAGGKGGLGGILGAVGGVVGNIVAPGVGGMIGGALGNAVGGAASGNTSSTAGGTGLEGADLGGTIDPDKMSETMKQQMMQKLMGDLQKLYEMLSNMIKSMHDMQMTPVRNLRG